MDNIKLSTRTARMETFIALLKRVEEHTDIPTDKHGIFTSHPLITVAMRIADILLIQGSGECDWDNIDTLKEAGYNVFPIEKDRFGWLIGGIELKNGVVAYG